jgi:hypothetical protein
MSDDNYDLDSALRQLLARSAELARELDALCAKILVRLTPDVERVVAKFARKARFEHQDAEDALAFASEKFGTEMRLHPQRLLNAATKHDKGHFDLKWLEWRLTKPAKQFLAELGTKRARNAMIDLQNEQPNRCMKPVDGIALFVELKSVVDQLCVKFPFPYTDVRKYIDDSLARRPEAVILAEIAEVRGLDPVEHGKLIRAAIVELTNILFEE